MRSKTMSFFLAFSAWLFKRPPKQQEVPTAIYRLVEVRQSSSGQYKLAVQLIGKSLVIEHAPQEILANDHMLEGFAKKDIRFIAYLACQQSKKPRYRIVMQEFCDKFNRILFKLKKRGSHEMISKTAGQISQDKYLINNLSQEDVCSISYAAGYEQSYLDRVKGRHVKNPSS